MSDKNIELAIKILQQDINVCEDLFDKNYFSLINIVANRYLENCLIFDEYKLCLPGVFIKDIVNDYFGIINNPDKLKNLNSAKVFGGEFLSKIRVFFKNKDEKSLWNDFYKYNLNMTTILRDEVDVHYLKNLSHSSRSFKFLLNYIKNHEEYLYIINNKFLEGILDIMVRVIRNHSFNLPELMIYIYVKYLGFLYQYFYYENFRNNQLNMDLLKKDLSIYLKYIISLKEREETDIKDFNKNLWNVVKKWREMYIFYKGLPMKRDVLIPLELKKNKINE